MLYEVWCPSFWNGEGSTTSEHLDHEWMKRELDPCTGAPTRTSRECRLYDTSRKHHRVFFLYIPYYFLAITFLELPC
jgi:hypothetical protein